MESRRLTSLKGAGSQGELGVRLLSCGSLASFPCFSLCRPPILPVLPLPEPCLLGACCFTSWRTMTEMLKREQEQGSTSPAPDAVAVTAGSPVDPLLWLSKQP